MLSDTMKQAIEELPAILTTQEVADFFLISYMTVYRLIKRKELKAYKGDEKKYFINRYDLKIFCSKNCNL